MGPSWDWWRTWHGLPRLSFPKTGITSLERTGENSWPRSWDIRFWDRFLSCKAFEKEGTTEHRWLSLKTASPGWHFRRWPSKWSMPLRSETEICQGQG